jgi:hypothetical protein
MLLYKSFVCITHMNKLISNSFKQFRLKCSFADKIVIDLLFFLHKWHNKYVTLVANFQILLQRKTVFFGQ